jgi:hypothetical protein
MGRIRCVYRGVLRTHWLRRSGPAISMFCFIALLGCSRTQRISILADHWENGQHKTCTFLVPGNLVCDAPDAPVTHWDAAEMLDETSGSIVVDRGDYNASFSSAVPDYSVWDCHKTGGDDVAIACSAMHKLSDDEFQKFQIWDAAEKQAVDTLAELKAERDAAQSQYKRCSSSSDYVPCVLSADESEKASLEVIDRKSQDVIDAANSEAAKVGRTFDPR